MRLPFLIPIPLSLEGDLPIPAIPGGHALISPMSAQRICSNACTTNLLPACIFETKTGRKFQRALLRKNENVLS